VIQEGNVFEKGGVNFSEVFGKSPEFLKRETRNPELDNFFATGLSLVIHPNSPMVPIIHMNVRYFEITSQCWFGGGIDLTPIYVNEDDAKFFHRSLKNVCDNFHAAYYPEFKNWADNYFFLPHRNETRGIGGIFFDKLTGSKEISIDERFEFVKAVGKIFVPVYSHLVEKNKNFPFSERHKQWQMIRRGRYVEFNLVYDKGTKFGLETGGRTESILMTLPQNAAWRYNHIPEKNSEEEKTLSLLKKGILWAN
jgi:coproporphyrinogen III oxidase